MPSTVVMFPGQLAKVVPLHKAGIVDPERRIRGLINGWERTLRRDFLAMVTRIKNTQNLETIANLLEFGRVTEAVELMRPHVAQFTGQINNAFQGSAQGTQGFLLDNNIVVSFNATHPRTVDIMANRQLRFTNGFMQQQEQATRQALTRGVHQGLGPREQARLFRDSVGLTPRQEQYIANYRQQLETLDRGALDRALRDGRFDRTVRNRIANNRPLTGKQIDKMVDRYRDRWVKYRSEVIARSESLSAVHQGNKEMYDQAIESGELANEQLEKTWHTAKDGRQRESHDAMDGDTVAHDELFQSGLGNQLDYPGDPGAPEEDTAQCRCAVTTRIKGEA